MNYLSFAPVAKRNSIAINKLMEDFFGKDLSAHFGTDFANNIPSVNVTEGPQGFELEIAAPGLSKEDFTIAVDRDQLTIKAEKKATTEETDKKYRRREFNYAKFERTFKLSDTVDTQAIGAKCEHGVLYVSLPKKETAKEQPARTIDIA